MKSKFRARNSAASSSWGPWLDLDTPQEAVRARFMAEGFPGGTQRYVVQDSDEEMQEFTCREFINGEIKVARVHVSKQKTRNRKIIQITSSITDKDVLGDNRCQVLALCDDGTLWHSEEASEYGVWVRVHPVPRGFTETDEET